MVRGIRVTAILAVVALIGLLVPAVSQSREVREAGGRGFFMVGGANLDINNLNARLKANGYPEFSKNLVSFGGSGYGIVNRVIIGGEGHTFFGRKTTIGDSQSSISAAYGCFNLGYLLYSKKGVNIYPIMGIGGGEMSFKIVERSSPTFDGLLVNPKRNAGLSTDVFLLSVGLGVDKLVNLGGDEKGEGGLAIGLQVGFTFAPNIGEWSLEERNIAGGPEIGITGPYVRLMFGGGGSGKD
ncbi:MAG: hypothetical protein QME66_01315 [Candidatus Eisenbacteria bacterium]|nr:hypothetical protein [Candidatus Eisenbacteria bacterium]